MTHDDPEVRYRALIAVQKYMTHAWYVNYNCYLAKV